MAGRDLVERTDETELGSSPRWHKSVSEDRTSGGGVLSRGALRSAQSRKPGTSYRPARIDRCQCHLWVRIRRTRPILKALHSRQAGSCGQWPARSLLRSSERNHSGAGGSPPDVVTLPADVCAPQEKRNRP